MFGIAINNDKKKFQESIQMYSFCFFSYKIHLCENVCFPYKLFSPVETNRHEMELFVSASSLFCIYMAGRMFRPSVLPAIPSYSYGVLKCYF